MDDVEEIKKLKARYWRGLDSKDWDLYGSVFAEDVVVDQSKAGGAMVEGRAAFVDFVKALKLVQSVHNGHNPEIELTSETTATGIWPFEDYNLWEDGIQNNGYGHYLETYEKVAGRWFIKTMKLSYLRIDRGHWNPPMYVAGAANTAHLRGLNPARRG